MTDEWAERTPFSVVIRSLRRYYLKRWGIVKIDAVLARMQNGAMLSDALYAEGLKK